MDALKCVVTGGGRAGRVLHGRTYQASPNVDVLAFVEPSAEVAEEVKSEFPKAKIYTHLEEALQEIKPDLVSICSPPDMHLEQARLAAEAGCHVMIEKPVVGTREDFEAMEKVKNSCKGKFGVDHNKKFMPEYKRLKQRLLSGEIGQARHFSQSWFRPIEGDRMLETPDHWSSRLPLGRFGETLPHNLYLIYDLLGPLKLEHVQASCTNPPKPWIKFDDAYVVLAGEGMTASCRMSFRCLRGVSPSVLLGDAGVLVAPEGSHYLSSGDIYQLEHPSIKRQGLGLGRKVGGTVLSKAKKVLKKGSPPPQSSSNDPLHLAKHSGLQSSLNAFVDYIVNGRSEPTTWDEVKWVMGIMFEIESRLKK